MANVIRAAKSSGDWTSNELIAYNIIVTSSSPRDFFSAPDLSLDQIDPDILTSPAGSTDPNISDFAAQYLRYLDLASRPIGENFINDFAAETLKLLGYNERGTTVSTRYTIPLTICGDNNCTAQADVCLIPRPTFILLVLVVEKILSNSINSKAQVIAEAIAAFQFNNRKREGLGLDPLDTMTIPAITMTGTRPTFFLVPVTMGLSNAVITGQYPAIQTQVLRCSTALAPARRAGMEDTEYRQLALKHFLAFKMLAKSHWERILEGV